MNATTESYTFLIATIGDIPRHHGYMSRAGETEEELRIKAAAIHNGAVGEDWAVSPEDFCVGEASPEEVAEYIRIYGAAYE